MELRICQISWWLQSLVMSFVRLSLIFFSSAVVAVAAPMSLSEALAVAEKVEEVSGKNYRLYSVSFEKKDEGAFYAFTFYDGENSLHSVNVDGDNNTRYQLREATKISLFEEVDFKSLPSAAELCSKKEVDGLVARAKKALEALGLKLAKKKSLRLTYHLRRNRNENGAAFHCWSVTLPSEEKGAGFRVGFVDGELKSVNPAKLR